MAAVKYLNSEDVFDRIYNEYEAAYGVTYPGFVSVLTELDAMLPANAELLDAGCGTASIPSQLFAEKGYTYHGIDISQEMIILARHNFPEGIFTKCNMLEYTPDKPLDALLAAHVFYQTPYHCIRAYLARMVECLKPRGIFLLCIVPGEKREPDLSLYDREWGFIDDRPTSFMGEPTRQTFITTAGWHKLIERCGFDITESGEYGYESNHPKAASEVTLFVFARRHE